MKRISCIGLGRVGQTLMKLFADTQRYEIGELVVSTTTRIDEIGSFVGCGRIVHSPSAVQESDLILITTGDSVIGEAARSLPDLVRLSEKTVIAHCSGALSSFILSQEGIVHAASIHPLKSFATPHLAASSFCGTKCSLEGDELACTALKSYFEDIGGEVFTINRDKKLLYHAGSVFASNYLHALTSVASRLFQECGVPDNLRGQIINSLMSATISNIYEVGNRKALTGPVARGEGDVLEAHAEALRQYDPSIEKLYLLLSEELVRIRDG